MELPVSFHHSESGNVYRTFLVASRTMTLNFSCDVGSFRIKHLYNLRNLFHKISELEFFFGDV